MTDPNSAAPERSNPITTILKEATKEFHSRLESLPYFEALIDHKLPLECYVNQLRALSVVHGVLETEIASSDDDRVRAVWEDDLRKLPLLQEDLAFFEPRGFLDSGSSIEAALALTAKIRLRGVENPVTLLGYLYVFEGSTLGNCMHRPDVSETFMLVGTDGCRYYSGYLDSAREHWVRFSATMNDVLADPALHDELTESAIEAFSGLESLYELLYPVRENDRILHASRFNPEAGNHPVPDDADEIQAALRAGQRSWDAFPYYDQRYGERGKRYTDSDACWLVTLTRLDQESLQKQIDWIGRVLATRGMPVVMLEKTLAILHDELVSAVPRNKADYDKLLDAAGTLRKARFAAIPEGEFDALTRDFDEAVGSELVEKLPEAGSLLAAAVADEKNGSTGAVAALHEWFTDQGRFPDKWVDAVNEIIEKARSVSP